MASDRPNHAAGPAGFIHKVFVVSPPTASGDRCAVPRTAWLQFLTCIAVVAGTLALTGTPASATPTTIRLVTAGMLRVQRVAQLDLPPGGTGNAIDTYTGTFSVSVTNFPTLPVTQPYAFTLSGTLQVGDSDYSFDNTSLPMASAAQANLLATDAKALATASSGPFFPDFLPETNYSYNIEEGTITIEALTDLATVFPDVGPFSALYTDGTYEINTSGLTLVATPQAVPEPASAALFGSALFGLGIAACYRRRIAPARFLRSPTCVHSQLPR